MEEYPKFKKQKIHNHSQFLPPIQNSVPYLKEILSTENAFKLCRVGAKKSKFINFDLKYTDDQNLMVPTRMDIKIPLLVYNDNYLNPFRQKSINKYPPHPLITSHVKQQSNFPIIMRQSLNSYSPSKQLKAKENNASLFIT